ncbi:hypothetical protein FA95DRAFT_103059 [Auriscalpium vulgare]|uniref:Uncharacterized protein n=1 Tax=Auriscalpium vulgare TaxID=40419 RepID=A0ACB8RN01_9AGAM|nr:hypothetical protein FA95DRAFT_103059 [Auriscalpium vulgare]
MQDDPFTGTYPKAAPKESNAIDGNSEAGNGRTRDSASLPTMTLAIRTSDDDSAGGPRVQNGRPAFNSTPFTLGADTLAPRNAVSRWRTTTESTSAMSASGSSLVTMEFKRDEVREFEMQSGSRRVTTAYTERKEVLKVEMQDNSCTVTDAKAASIHSNVIEVNSEAGSGRDTSVRINSNYLKSNTTAVSLNRPAGVTVRGANINDRNNRLTLSDSYSGSDGSSQLLPGAKIEEVDFEMQDDSCTVTDAKPARKEAKVININSGTGRGRTRDTPVRSRGFFKTSWHVLKRFFP